MNLEKEAGFARAVAFFPCFGGCASLSFGYRA